MHEFAVAQSIVETASAEAEKAGAHRVTALLCRIGVLRQINDDLLREAFAMASGGTMCEQAELRIEKMFMQATCGQCDHTYAVRDWEWVCPKCGSETSSVRGGDELDLVSLEAEVADEDSSAQERV